MTDSQFGTLVTEIALAGCIPSLLIAVAWYLLRSLIIRRTGRHIRESETPATPPTGPGPTGGPTGGIVPPYIERNRYPNE